MTQLIVCFKIHMKSLAKYFKGLAASAMAREVLLLAPHNEEEQFVYAVPIG